MGKEERWDHSLWLQAHSHALKGEGRGSRKLDVSHAGYSWPQALLGQRGKKDRVGKLQPTALSPGSLEWKGWCPRFLSEGPSLIFLIRAAVSLGAGPESP